MTSDDPPFTLDFYVEPDTGRAPVHEWITRDLSPFQRRSLGVAMSEILQRHGIQVCGSEYGKQLGQGLFEFRLRHGADEIAAMFTTRKPDARDREAILLRVYCHAYGDKIVLLLAGYDKLSSPSKKRENAEITLARRRLADFKARTRAKDRPA
jgi:phage-related protein